MITSCVEMALLSESEHVCGLVGEFVANIHPFLLAGTHAPDRGIQWSRIGGRAGAGTMEPSVIVEK